MKNFYNVILESVPDGVSVCFPDFPGCVSAGRDYAEALEHGETALALHLAGMNKDSIAIPDKSDPAALEEFFVGGAGSGAMPVGADRS